MKINIAKALKVKNRLAGRLRKIEAAIKQANQGQTWESDAKNMAWKVKVEPLNELREKILGGLVIVKSATQKANQGILSELILLAEMKTTLGWLGSIPASEEDAGYRTRKKKVKDEATKQETETEEQQVHVCQWNAEIIKKKTAATQKDIEALQDKVDEYNASTFIELPDDIQSLLDA